LKAEWQLWGLGTRDWGLGNYKLVAGWSCWLLGDANRVQLRWVTLGAAASSEQRVGERAVLAAAGSVRPQHAAVGRCAQRAAQLSYPIRKDVR
jgi:hypothetical protein